MLQAPIDPEEVTLTAANGRTNMQTYYLALVLRGLAYHPQLLKTLFDTRMNEVGFHQVTIFANGKPQVVVLDDKIPFQDECPAYIQPQGKNLWPLVLEKAWAKLCGGYGSGKQHHPAEVLQQLAGCRCINFKLESEKDLEAVFSQYGIVFAIARKDQAQSSGLKPQQPVLLTGSGSGPYRVQAPVKLSLGQGCYLTAEEVLQLFQQISLCRTNPTPFHSLHQIAGHYSYFSLQVHEDSSVFLRVTQQNKAFVKGQYDYCPVTVDLLAQEGQWQEMTAYDQRSVCNSFCLHSGHYILRVRAFWQTTQDICSNSLSLQASQMSEEAGKDRFRQQLGQHFKGLKTVPEVTTQGIAYWMEWHGSKGLLYLRNCWFSSVAFKVQFSDCRNTVFQGESSPRSTKECEVSLQRGKERVILFEQFDCSEGAKVGKLRILKTTF